MQIVCTTPQAAANVLQLLFAAELRPIHDFEISPVLSIVPPITYTLLCILTCAQRTKLSALADTTIVE